MKIPFWKSSQQQADELEQAIIEMRLSHERLETENKILKSQIEYQKTMIDFLLRKVKEQPSEAKDE